MSNNIERPPHISQEDWDAVDVPELTDEQMAQMRPFAEMFPVQYAAQKNKGGRPKLDHPKRKVSWRLSAEVIDGVEATGPGYNSRVDAVLKDALAKGIL